MMSKSPNAIMHADHWPAEWSDESSPVLKKYRQGMLHGFEATAKLGHVFQNHQAAGIAALGDAEAAILGFRELAKTPGVSMEWLSKLAARSGFAFDEYDWARGEIIDAIAAEPVTLMPYRWNVVERLTQIATEGLPIRCRIWAHALFDLQLHAELRRILKGHRVLIVGGHAVEVARQMSDIQWKLRHSLDFTYAIVESIRVPNRFQAKRPHWESICRQMHQSDWTIALVSAGGLAFPIVNEARRMGRLALDIGKVDVAILGGEHEWTKGFEFTGVVPDRNGPHLSGETA